MEAEENECEVGKYMCLYQKIAPTKDVNGTEFYTYYCSCEDEMCATCIPSYRRIIHHGLDDFIIVCDSNNIKKTDEELYEDLMEWQRYSEKEKQEREERRKAGTLTGLDKFLSTLDEDYESPKRIALFCPNCEATRCTVMNDKYICKMCYTEMQEKVI
jgi:hypothetical protein